MAIVVFVSFTAALPATEGTASDGWRQCRSIRGVTYHYVSARKVSCRSARPFLRRMQREGWGRWARGWDCTDTGKRLICTAVDRSGRSMMARWLR